METTTPSIDSTVVGDLLDQAVRDVFDTMVKMETRLVWFSDVGGSTEGAAAAGAPDPDPSETRVVGAVGFIGDVNGLVYLHVGLPLANDLTHRMLQLDLSELGADAEGAVNDAVGELTNMVVGCFKNKLCDQGFPCRLTIPSIVRGSNLSIEPVGYAHRRVYRFAVDHFLLTTDVVMKFGD